MPRPLGLIRPKFYQAPRDNLVWGWGGFRQVSTTSGWSGLTAPDSYTFTEVPCGWSGISPSETRRHLAMIFLRCGQQVDISNVVMGGVTVANLWTQKSAGGLQDDRLTAFADFVGVPGWRNDVTITFTAGATYKTVTDILMQVFSVDNHDVAAHVNDQGSVEGTIGTLLISCKQDGLVLAGHNTTQLSLPVYPNATFIDSETTVGGIAGWYYRRPATDEVDIDFETTSPFSRSSTMAISYNPTTDPLKQWPRG